MPQSATKSGNSQPLFLFAGRGTREAWFHLGPKPCSSRVSCSACCGVSPGTAADTLRGEQSRREQAAVRARAGTLLGREHTHRATQAAAGGSSSRAAAAASSSASAAAAAAACRPWRCLCLGDLSHTTKTVPLRRTTRHASHSLRTEERTYARGVSAQQQQARKSGEQRTLIARERATFWLSVFRPVQRACSAPARFPTRIAAVCSCACSAAWVGRSQRTPRHVA